jgi:hypothetical protein
MRAKHSKQRRIQTPSYWTSSWSFGLLLLNFGWWLSGLKPNASCGRLSGNFLVLGGKILSVEVPYVFVMILHTKIIYQICVDIRALRGAPRISEVHRYLLETYRNGSIYVERQDCIDFMFLSFFNDLKIYIRIFQRYRRLKSAAPIAPQTCTTYTYLSSYLCLYAIGEKKTWRTNRNSNEILYTTLKIA